jgi:hypothetical protein
MGLQCFLCRDGGPAASPACLPLAIIKQPQIAVKLIVNIALPVSPTYASILPIQNLWLLLMLSRFSSPWRADLPRFTGKYKSGQAVPEPLPKEG